MYGSGQKATSWTAWRLAPSLRRSNAGPKVSAAPSMAGARRKQGSLASLAPLAPVLAGLALSGCHSATPLPGPPDPAKSHAAIEPLLGKSRAEVERILGKPDTYLKSANHNLPPRMIVPGSGPPETEAPWDIATYPRAGLRRMEVDYVPAYAAKDVEQSIGVMVEFMPGRGVTIDRAFQQAFVDASKATEMKPQGKTRIFRLSPTRQAAFTPEGGQDGAVVWVASPDLIGGEQ